MKKTHVMMALILSGALLFSGCGGATGGTGSTSAAAGGAKENGDVLTTVDDTKITLNEYKKYILLNGKMTEASFGKDVWTYPINENQTFREYFKKSILDQLISKVLIEKAAQDQKITVSDEEIQKEETSFNNYADQIEGFRDALKEGAIDDAFIKNFLRTEILVDKYMRQYGESQQISEEEIKAYYDSHDTEFKKEEVKVAHILFKTTNAEEQPLSEEEIAKKKTEAEAVLTRVKAGEDFAALAKEYSDDSSAANGGDIGYGTFQDWVPEFSTAAFDLKPGETSGIVQSVYGYHIIKCEDKKTIETSLVDATQEIKAALLNEIVGKHVEELKNKATIKTDEELLKTVE